MSSPAHPDDRPRHRVPLVVRFSDLDPLGHLNNVAVVRMLETGRVEFAHETGMVADPTAPSFVLAALHLDFRAQGFHRDELVIGTGVTRIGRTSLTLTQQLWRSADGGTIARGEAVLVVLGDDRRSPAPVPDDWRDRLAAW